MAITRPFCLHDLVIPSDLPSHAPVEVARQRPPSAPKPNQRPAGRRTSHSHLHRMQSLRAASNASTPTLSPLMLSSPSPKAIAKHAVRAPAGGARAYAAFLRANQPGASRVHVSTEAPVRMVRTGGGASAAAPRSGSHSLRPRPQLSRPMRAPHSLYPGLPVYQGLGLIGSGHGPAHTQYLTATARLGA